MNRTSDLAPATGHSADAQQASSQTRRRILVIADEACGNPAICRDVDGRTGRDAEVLVVAPRHPSEGGRWIVDENKAAAEAERRVRASVACLEKLGIRAHARLGDEDPVTAIEDALHGFRADEIVVFTHPHEQTGWLHKDVVTRARARFSQPIMHVVVDNG